MISLGVQKILVRAYVLIKLSLLFWAYAFSGLLIFGIGPALLTIAELYQQHQWSYEKIKFKAGWQLFKRNFKFGNLYFYLLATVLTGLGINLFLSVQTPGLAFLVTDFVIMFVICLVLSMFHYGLLLNANYEVNLRTTLKLSFIQFFNNFLDVIKLLAGFIAILIITYKFPGLILFATVPAFIVWTTIVSKKWYQKLAFVI
ncbi:DUF624 domain-containing protein [Pediococcus inopinatus]|uniref:DUF624 domain-containing protein n=1 Tax=Pediococcus inopinatus TaxID=114090 RepID=A0ABZ0Q3S8_9LACO|nr:DUF624 domain-containing protein [Pediococcus inopinatus]AVL00731.1 hypothetical protein PI20285_08815 [Pediococcus inopinatus]KRN61451.1 hypothetical protein IV83_GL000867 [Pediococcus inopinatus]WPC16955.1 DUF624 domain-containing protein [Pediococcus inopinatus]WPC19926.1 DUF624 domain-containing protein [Pediococcus inopinatus]WPC21626.1 DUF624 domain-containing protein [Pediococcus inopinatus]